MFIKIKSLNLIATPKMMAIILKAAWNNSACGGWVQKILSDKLYFHMHTYV